MIEIQAYPGAEIPRGRVNGFTSEVGIVSAACLVALATLWFAGHGPLLRVAIPGVATVLGLFLYLRHPILYVQYVLWVWFLAPLVRRVVDLSFGWTDPNLILLAPLLVSAIAGLTLVRRNEHGAGGFPAVFVLCGTAISYGFLVGMLLHPSVETIYAFLNWLCPLLFGLHLYLSWPHYQEYSIAIRRTFLWAVLAVGAYGVYQFLNPPAWDVYWLENIRVGAPGSSFGVPEPLMVRVWSTINAPGPFANMMMVGLLLLFSVRSPLKLPAAAAGYISLLLSAVRSAWLGWVVGLFWILKDVSSRVVARIVLSIVLLLVCLVPVVTQPHLASVIGTRLESFSDLGHDESLGARAKMYRVLTSDALSDPFGQGLSNLEVARGIAIDSGLLTLVFSMGWLGSVLFAAGIFSLFLRKGLFFEKQDEFLSVCKAAMIAILAEVIGGNVFVSITGVLLWMLAGMYLAAHRYHNYAVMVVGETMSPSGLKMLQPALQER